MKRKTTKRVGNLKFVAYDEWNRQFELAASRAVEIIELEEINKRQQEELKDRDQRIFLLQKENDDLEKFLAEAMKLKSQLENELQFKKAQNNIRNENYNTLAERVANLAERVTKLEEWRKS